MDAELVRYFTAELAGWKRRLAGREAPRSIYKEWALPSLSAEPDLAWESQAERARAFSDPALRAMLEPFFVEYFANARSVLEVGAGTLARGRSYLSRYFERLDLEWTPSDGPAVVRRWRGVARALELPLTGGAPGAARFDRVVASNVFDTIPYADFAEALTTIRRQVRPGGAFVHVADLNFYVNAFLDACGTPDVVLFPGPHPHKTVLAMPRAAFAPSLAAAAPPDRDFLTAWGEAHAQIQAVTIGHAFLRAKDLSTFCARAQELFRLNPLHQIGLFQRHLVAAALTTGWDVQECGFRTGEVHLPRRDLGQPFNAYELDEGAVLGRIDPDVPAGMERVRAKVHVFRVTAR